MDASKYLLFLGGEITAAELPPLRPRFLPRLSAVKYSAVVWSTMSKKSTSELFEDPKNSIAAKVSFMKPSSHVSVAFLMTRRNL